MACRIFCAFQRTSTFNGDFSKSYMIFERKWDESSETLLQNTSANEGVNIPAPEIPAPEIPQVVRQPSRPNTIFQSLMHRIMGQGDIPNVYEVGGQHIPQPQQVHGPQTSQSAQNSQAISSPIYIKQVKNTKNMINLLNT